MTSTIKYTIISGVLLLSVLGITFYTKQPAPPVADKPNSIVAENTPVVDNPTAVVENAPSNDSVVLSGATQNTQKVVTIKPSVLFDFSDDRVLMGASQNVFVGKVIKQVGTKARSTVPETQFSVGVIFNIKGNLQGTVMVNQEGGYKNSVLYIMDEGEVSKLTGGNGYLLLPGSTYLFTTRYSKIQNWYTLNSSSAADKLLIKDSTLSSSQIEAKTKNNERVKKLQIIYPNEILSPFDIETHNTANSFQSLPVVEQERIKAEAERLKAGMAN